MAWDGSGTFTRTDGTRTGTSVWQDARDAGVKIRADDHDTHDQDLATGIGACLTKNNESKPTATFSPNADAAYDLGGSSAQWRDLYLSGDIKGDVGYTGIQRWAKGADVASASALALGNDGNYFDITGTTAITSIGTKGIGTVVKVHFDGALTLTHHATNLILPGGANITTAAGDEAEFVEYGTGTWRCTNYIKATGTALSTIINAETAETSISTSDEVLIYDTSATANRKATIANVRVAIMPVVQADIDTAAVGQGELITSTGTFSGTISSSSAVDIAMTAYAFFPMINVADQLVQLTGHITDGASADAPRFGMQNPTGSGVAYNIDYRYITA